MYHSIHEKHMGIRLLYRHCIWIVPVLLLAFLLYSCEKGQASIKQASVKAKTSEEAGKYLVLIGGCNDCHTVGYYPEINGKVPESEWLTGGGSIGFRGPWGTTYPPNLRIFVDETPEDEFVTIAKTRTQNPPMPWPSLNNMSEQDLRAIYRYIKSLGVKGTRAPEAVPAGQEPTTPYILFEPVHMERLSQISK